jgi:ubiquinone/menaquinone biosynthesis C-methylase UbiE
VRSTGSPICGADIGSRIIQHEEMRLTNPYISSRSAEGSAQERNRAWWEAMPMTYRDWNETDRSTNRDQAIGDFLSGNPWFTEEFFTRQKGKSVLEIGCGSGAASVLFAKGGAKVTAIDLTQAAVDMTSAHTKDLNVTVQRMDAEQLAFPDGSFDYIFSWGVLHHSSNPEKAFAEVARVLKSGGSAFIMVYSRSSARYWIKGLARLFLKGDILRGETMDSVQRFHTDGYFHRHFTASEFSRAVRPLRVARISYSHMAKKMIPVIPRSLDEFGKRHWGWFLIAELTKQ